jgi:hypothetical protein
MLLKSNNIANDLQNAAKVKCIQIYSQVKNQCPVTDLDQRAALAGWKLVKLVGHRAGFGSRMCVRMEISKTGWPESWIRFTDVCSDGNQ